MACWRVLVGLAAGLQLAAGGPLASYAGGAECSAAFAPGSSMLGKTAQTSSGRSLSFCKSKDGRGICCKLSDSAGGMLLAATEAGRAHFVGAGASECDGQSRVADANSQYLKIMATAGPITVRAGWVAGDGSVGITEGTDSVHNYYIQSTCEELDECSTSAGTRVQAASLLWLGPVLVLRWLMSS